MGNIYQSPTIGNTTLTVAASDSSDFAKARAQYRCDGTEDEVQIQAAIDALPATGGTVHLAAGNYYIDAATVELPQGCYLEGEGRGATVVQSGASHTLTADTGLITLKGVDADDLHWYSGVMRMSIIGDGGVDESSSNGSRPDGNATIYGIDASLTGEAVSPTVQNSQLVDVAIQKCKVGWYSGTTNVRYCPVYMCDIWYCDKGFEFTDHPNFRLCDFRYNEYAVYGRAAADVRFVGCKFVGNEYGIDDSATTGMNICNVVGCEFANNVKYGLRVGANSVVTGNSFMMTSSVITAEAAIQLMYYRCTISGNKFTCQTSTSGWSNGCIVLWSGERGDMCSFNDNQFTNGRGPIFGFDAANDALYTVRRLENAVIDGNTFALLGYPIIESTSINNWWRYVNFSNNVVTLYANLGAKSVFSLASPTDGGTLEINFIGNTFRNDTGAYTHAAVLNIDLDGCVVKDNRFSGWTTILKSGYTFDENTRISGNIGLDLSIGNTALTVAASDSTDFTKAIAQYVCDGTADEVQIQAALDALPATGGTVHLAAGNYYVSDTTITMDEGQYITGEGTDATELKLHGSTSLTTGDAIITLASSSEFSYGGIRDLAITGDGGIEDDADGNDKPDGTATVDGINMNLDGLLNPLIQWEMQNVIITRCRRGVNGELSRQRLIPVLNCVFYYNDVGWYAYEHPTFIRATFRYNDVGIGGEPFDCTFFATSFAYNNVGIEKTGETDGVENCFFTACTFFANKEVDAKIGPGCIVSGCYVGTGTVLCAKGIVITDGDVQIVGNRLAAQANTNYGWTDGVVYFQHHSGRHIGTLIDGNLFANHVGPAIGAEVDGNDTGYKRGIKITNNTFRLYTGSATCLQFAGYYNYSIQFSGNSTIINDNFDFGGAALVYIRNNAAGGSIITDNIFEFIDNTDCTNGYIFDGSLINTKFCNNMARNADTFPWFTSGALSATNSATRIQNNHILTSGGAALDGFRTRFKGTATVANGATTVDVTHGLSATPDSVILTPTNNLGNASHFFVSDIGTTTFRINVDSDPGATTATFNWVASVYEGG